MLDRLALVFIREYKGQGQLSCDEIGEPLDLHELLWQICYGKYMAHGIVEAKKPIV